jgi:UDP-N-acetylmuramyl pentapeptide synthase
MTQATYHSGPRNYGTGFDMMKRIDELEADNARYRQAIAHAMTELGQSAQDAHAIRAEAALERAFRAALSTDPVGEA